MKKSIPLAIRQMQDKYPLSSSFIVLTRAVEGRHYTRRTIVEWFKAYVDKNDYSSKDAQRLIEHLVVISEIG